MHDALTTENGNSELALERYSAAIDALSASMLSRGHFRGFCDSRTLVAEGYWTETRVWPQEFGGLTEEVRVAIVQNKRTLAKIEWTPTADEILTSIGVGISLFNRSDLFSELIWRDWCHVTGNEFSFIIEDCWSSFETTNPKPFIRNFHIEVVGSLYLRYPEIYL